MALNSPENIRACDHAASTVSRTVDVDPATALLWVLRDHLGPTGTKYGCGIA